MPLHLQISIKQFSSFVSLFTLLLQPFNAQAELTQTPEMAAQTRWVMSTINARHYLNDSIVALDGTEIVEAYVESFDYSRMYFNRTEIDDFIFRFSDAMESFLEKGNLYAAFDIYKSYKQKVQARTEWINEQLEQDYDFLQLENFNPDRSEAKWPMDAAAGNQLWNKRLKYELLNELLSLAGEAPLVAAEDGAIIVDTAQVASTEITVKSADILAVAEDQTFDPAKIQRLLQPGDFFTQMLNNARKKIQRRYQRNLGYTLDREAAEVQEAFINAMTQLFDPHSSFLSADTLESFNSAVQNSFVGIGAALQDEDGICTIKELLPGGPAERSRLLGAEDQILAVAQGLEGEFEDVVDMQLRYIVRKIKGKKNTLVRLLIHPGDATDPSVRKDISIIRDEVKLTANLASAKLIRVPSEDQSSISVGVIELPSFYGNIGAGNTLTTTTDDVEELIGKLRSAGAEGIILDLRSNGGGLLSEAVRLAGLFIPVGPVVQVHDNDGRTDVLSDRNPKLEWEGPLIVLTSRFSASASEIVAGALQDHDRALIVGNRSTHGKGTVQEVYHMNNRPAFSWFTNVKPNSTATRPVASKITIKQFYLPDGSSTQVQGVHSDIALPSVNEFLPIGEDDLPHALPWNSIKAVDWHNDWKKLGIDAVEDPELKNALRAASQSRMADLEEFKFLQKQIDWRQTRYQQKEVSLHLESRIKKKVSEQSYIDQLDANFETLSKNDYAMDEFKVAVAELQQEESRLNLLQPLANSDALPSKEEEEEPTYDIYLREGARIMADWIQILKDSAPQKVLVQAQLETDVAQ